jgi:hypothetical protein
MICYFKDLASRLLGTVWISSDGVWAEAVVISNVGRQTSTPHSLLS